MLRAVLLFVAVALCATGITVAPALGVESPSVGAKSPSECFGTQGEPSGQCHAGWEVTGRSYPTRLSSTVAAAPRVSGTIGIDVFNVGGAASHGRITVTDTLPAGVRAVDAGELGELVKGGGIEPTIGHSLWVCTGNGPGLPPSLREATVVTCTNSSERLSEIAGGGGAPTHVTNVPHPQPTIGISVDVQPGAEERETNHVTIAGGGAPTSASAEDAILVSSSPPSFEITGWDGWFSNASGTLDTQAGSHPYEATFSFDLATALKFEGGKVGGETAAGGEARRIEVELPPGVVGNPTAVPQCTREEFDAETCPQQSQIGVAMVYFAAFAPDGLQIFNLVPPPGVPAEFGFTISSVNTFQDASVRSGGNYGINEHVNNIVQKEIVHVVETLWGDPEDPSHSLWRNGQPGGCKEFEETEPGNTCARIEHPIQRAFLTLPTACGAAQPFVIKATSWTGRTSESTFFSHDANGEPTGFTGCGFLGFGPSFATEPESGRADTPVGLNVEVKSPLGGLEEPENLGTADIEGARVALPPGVVVNPGQAAGLEACGPGEDGLTSAAEEARGEEDDGPPSCPAASKVGTVKAKSPLLESALEKELEGNIYVLQSNPPDLKLLATVSADGVNIKLVLNVELNEQTGQITTAVVDAPQFPVSDFRLSFDGGAQAALDTPAQCGSYQTTSDFTPWAGPFISDAFPTAQFAIGEGPGGSGCPSSPMAFTPTLTAGSSDDQAGGFTSFSALLQREDGTQRVEKLQGTGPAGLAAMISNVSPCTSAQAAADACPEASQVGYVVVAAGPGSNPLLVPQPGQPQAPVFLTESYEGAPFGFLIKVPLKVGPFELDTQVVRGKIEVNPITARVTVVTDPLPQIVDGVPVDMRSAYVVFDRHEFVFNPTNCASQEIAGTATGTEPPGVSGPAVNAPLSSRFQVGSCQSLKFAPTVSVATGAHGSKANGSSLKFKISYPKGAVGTQSWFRGTKFDIPKQLPARLTTLQKACLAATFETNRAACPKQSAIGTAIVHTPVLPVPLEGKVYFVSYGGAKFPDVVIVLSGDNVNIQLTGETLIKAGVTSATFRNLPDVPFENIEVTLPTGPYSELGANLPAKDNYDFCGQKLTMPTAFTAQNGLEIHRNTPVVVSGCPAIKKHSSKSTKKAKRRMKR